MSEVPSPRRGLSDDLKHGQIVIVIARWVLVVVGLLFILWNPGPIGVLRIQVTVVLLLAFANFYLHTEILRQRPWAATVAYGASAGDLFVITLVIVSQGGFASNAFAFYFPAILAFSVAFPGLVTLLYTGGLTFVYFLIALGTFAVEEGGTSADFQVMVARLLMIVAVAVCGNLYRRIETQRREGAQKAQELLEAQLRERAA